MVFNAQVKIIVQLCRDGNFLDCGENRSEYSEKIVDIQLGN